MKLFTVTAENSGQRLDKYLRRIMPEASQAFLQKMLRKKNIKCNGARAEASDHVKEGDVVEIYLSDETFLRFSGTAEKASAPYLSSSVSTVKKENLLSAYRNPGAQGAPLILYEDNSLLFLIKPPGMLSQKAAPGDISANEWMLGYLLENGELTEEKMRTFRPSVCNRLDRGTGGILLCGKNLPGARFLSEMLRERKMEKYYAAVVWGNLYGSGEIKGYLKKDEARNQVEFHEKPVQGAVMSLSRYTAVEHGNGLTLLELELITGKTHQLRAHLAHIGHPIAGDRKYGTEKRTAKYDLKNQLLYCTRVTFPQIEGDFSYLSGKSFTVDIPQIYRKILH